MKISIIIPTFNRPQSIKRCVESIRNNNFKDYEVIVVSDGKDFDNDSIFYNWKKNKRIKYIRAKHRGPGSARNEGIKIAKGEIVVFLDDDCVVSDNWIKNIYEEHRKNPQIDAIVGNIKQMNRGAISDHLHEFEPENYFMWKNNQKISPIKVNNVSYKHRVIQILKKFVPELKTAEDVEWNSRFTKKNMHAIYSKNIEITHEYRTTLKEFIQQTFSFGQGRFFIFVKKGDYPEDRRNLLIYTLRLIITPIISPLARFMYAIKNNKKRKTLYFILGVIYQISYWTGFFLEMCKYPFKKYERIA
jgi:glycosyltransferase involved in cell wall biosynthesis